MECFSVRQCYMKGIRKDLIPTFYISYTGLTNKKIRICP
ncbi:unnamed protein product [Brassica rapa subsp. narinosa]